MKGTPTEFFSLSLEERKRLVTTKPIHVSMSEVPLDKINDSSSFLEYLRAYMLAEMLGKYKIF